MNKGRIIVKEAMKINPVSVRPNDTVKHAASLMKKHKIGNCIVGEKKPIGIITESDIVRKVVSENKNPQTTLIETVMSTPLLIIDPYIDIEEAAKTMAKCNIRRLPIIENGELVGIITEKDINRLSPILHEITEEWYQVSKRDEIHYKQQVFSGICEDCNTLSSHLKNINGRLLCEDCAEELNYES